MAKTPVNSPYIFGLLVELGFSRGDLERKSGLSMKTLTRLEDSGLATENVRSAIVEALVQLSAERGRQISRTQIAAGVSTGGEHPSHAPAYLPESMPPWRERAASTAVLILAAGPVPEGVMSQAHVDNICLVPLLDKPVLQRNVEYLKTLGFKQFYVGVQGAKGLVQDFCSQVFQDEVQLIEDPELRGVAGTAVLLAKRAERNGARSVLVVLGDTVFTFADPAVLELRMPVVLYKNASFPHRWCTVHRAGGRAVFVEKRPERIEGATANVLIGVYFFDDVRALSRYERPASAGEMPFEMSEVLNSFKEVHLAEALDWWDVGHPDRHIAAHVALLQRRDTSTRYFNVTRIDLLEGSVTKSLDEAHASERDRETLRDEINYYRLLPSPISPLFPRLLEYDAYSLRPSLKLEYYGYATLSGMFLFGQLHPEIWGEVFTRLAATLGVFHRVTSSVNRAAMNQMYLDKTKRRLDELQEQMRGRSDPHSICLARLMCGELSVDGTPTKGLGDLLEDARPGIDDMVASCEAFSVIHGDCHFSNVLHDLAHGMFRFVDPRGAFGEKGIMGDPLYDVAKLYHSVDGLYASMASGMFSLSDGGHAGSVTLRLYTPTCGGISSINSSGCLSAGPRGKRRRTRSPRWRRCGDAARRRTCCW